MAFLLDNPMFRTFVAGSGFFADSYDLFVTDGVTNILKNIGPVNKVVQTYAYLNATAPSGVSTGSMTTYATFMCPAQDASCGAFLQPSLDNATWAPNSAYDAQYLPRYAVQTGDLKNAVSNAALIGSIVGQLLFGTLGDVFGRKWSFVLTSSLIILGALGSATAAAGQTVPGALALNGLWSGSGATTTGVANDVYTQLVLWRAILGVGVGGEYPLASTITSEGSTTASRGKAVLTTFSMQGWGKLTASITNYALVATLTYYGGPWVADATWRFALAFGCVLNILTMYWRLHMHESKIFTETRKRELAASNPKPEHLMEMGATATAVDDNTVPRPALATVGKAAALEGGDGTTAAAAYPLHALPNSVSDPLAAHVPQPLSAMTTLRLLWEYKWKLAGTASTWFLIDVTFYGQSLMNTTVVNNSVTGVNGVSNSVDKLRLSLLSTVYIMLIALPGYWVAIALVDKMGRWWMQMQGFVMSALCFAVLALAYNTPLRTSANGAGFVIVYGMTYFFANFGPNSTTFLMPVEVFPTRVRATAHGLSAAFGKVGATVGSYGLLALYNSFCTSSGLNCSGAGVNQEENDAGIKAVMWACVAVSLFGAAMTAVFVRESGGRSLEDVDAESHVLQQALGAGAVAGGGDGRMLVPAAAAGERKRLLA